MTNKRRNLDPRYAAGEFFWYNDPTGSLDFIKHYAPQYVNFANDGTVIGAYGPRITGVLDDVINHLAKKPSSRRAVIPLFRPWDCLVTDVANDVPCTLSYTLMIIEDRLCMIANMRSNDIWLGMPYDVFVNTVLQRMIAARLGIRAGWYQHQVADLHLYDRNRDAAVEAVKEGWGDNAPACWDDFDFEDESMIQQDLLTAMLYESTARNGGCLITKVKNTIRSKMLRALTQVVVGDTIESEVLENAYTRRYGLRRQDDAVS